MPNWEKTTVEQLQSEVSDLEKLLNELKTKTFSDAEREKKEKDAKSKAEKLQWQIDALSKQEWIDPKLAEEKEKAKVLLESYEKTLGLKSSIKEKPSEWSKTDKKETTDTTQTQTQPEEQNPGETAEEKWFFWKAWDWIWEQWSDVRSGEKRKEQPWKNILRTVGFWVTWYAIYKWVKKLWNRAFWKKKKDEESESESSSESSSKKDTKEEEKSFWDKPVWKFIKWVWAVLWVWTGVYYVAHGLYTQNRWLRDLWDWERGKKLEFDTALEYCKWAIANQDNKEWMSYGIDLKYNESTSEIEAYWEKIKIDKDKRKIEWLNVEFKKYEHMINTAILIAYLKKNYSWQCQNNSPFHLTGDWQWDIDVKTSNGSEEAVDWTGNWGRIVGVTAWWIAWVLTWIFGWLNAWVAVTAIWCTGWYMLGSTYDHNNIMNDHMPELDNEYWKKSLWAYLNSMACRKARHQSQEDITESPIKDKVRECIDEIQRENPELPARWWRRQFDMIQDPNNKDKYTIKVYGREISAEVKWTSWNETIRILWISWWNPKIKTDMSKWDISNLELPLKEGIYMTSLLWFFLDTFHHKWNEYPRFKYDWKAAKLITTGFWLWWNNNWIYFSDSGMNTFALSWEKFEQRMPTLFNASHGERFIKFLNDWITDEDNISIRKELD